MRRCANMSHAGAIALFLAGTLMPGQRSAYAQAPPSSATLGSQERQQAQEGDDEGLPPLPARVRRDCWLRATPGEPKIPCAFAFGVKGGPTNERAVLVRERGGARRRGIAVRVRGGGVQILGAGVGVASLGADLGWIKAWMMIHPRDPDNSSDRDLLLLAGAPSPRPGMPDAIIVVSPGEDAENVDLYGPRDRRPPFFETLGLTDPRRRFVAFDLLERYDVTPAKRWLLPGLDDPDQLARLAAASVLAASKVGEAAESIAAWLAPGRLDVSPFTWRQIARDLGQLGSPAGVPALERALGDAAPEVREAAVWALAEIGDTGSPALIAGRIEDPDPRVRRQAAVSLGVVGGPGVAAVLLKAFADPDQRTRLAAVESASGLELRALIPAFIERLHDPDGEVQYAAVGAVDKLRARDAVPHLMPLLTARGPRMVRHHQLCWSPEIWLPLDCAAARALMNIGDPAGISEARKRVPHCMSPP